MDKLFTLKINTDKCKEVTCRTNMQASWQRNLITKTNRINDVKQMEQIQ